MGENSKVKLGRANRDEFIQKMYRNEFMPLLMMGLHESTTKAVGLTAWPLENASIRDLKAIKNGANEILDELISRKSKKDD